MGYKRNQVVLLAPEGILKRAALEAGHRAKRARSQPRIQFRYKIPFTQIPELVKEGFTAQV